MALHNILNDPHISQFLEQIPQKEHIVTLKELLYIGIKIVSNSFNQPPNNNSIMNKQNISHNLPNNNFSKNKTISQKNNLNQNVRRKTHSDKGNQQKIESTLLREISKIRLQLESLTNKVYDHCFNNQQQEESNQVCEDSFEQAENYNPSQNLLTFSQNCNKPNKPRQCRNKAQQRNNNPFLKQKNNFFITQSRAQPHIPQRARQKSLQNRQDDSFVERNRAKSHIMHLDDTQVRQALYKPDAQLEQESRFGKSRSLVEKKHEQKRKAQENYFYQLAVDKRRVKQLQKIKQKKNYSSEKYQVPERDHTNNLEQGNKKTIKNSYHKKAKSKIKKLVERDRLRHQQKMNQYNFQKGFQQYQYSANEFSDEGGQESSQQNKNTVPYQEPYIVPIGGVKVKSHFVSQQQEESAQQRVNSQKKSPLAKPLLNPNFGFYSASQKDNSNPVDQSSFSNQRKLSQLRPLYQKQDQNINICSNSSSFSEFSMSGSSRASRRQAGKISRRRYD